MKRIQKLPVRCSLPLLAAVLAPATTALADVFSFTGTGQIFTAPATGIYDITAYGAQGGGSQDLPTGGLGALASAYFNLTAGEKLDIFVGGQGGSGALPGRLGGGGGGGSFVIIDSTFAPLVVAGGGGGAGFYGTTGTSLGGNGESGSSGQAGFGLNGGAGGTGGSGGRAGTGGAANGAGGTGFSGNGQDADGGAAFGGPSGGAGPLGGNGAYKNSGYSPGDNHGGYGGGGGGGLQGGGGGGGYSGGGGGDGSDFFGGGGGGSYIDPSDISAFEASGFPSPYGSPNGYVDIAAAPEPAQWLGSTIVALGAGAVWLRRRKGRAQ